MYGQYSTGRFPSSTSLFPISAFSFLNLLLRSAKSARQPHETSRKAARPVLFCRTLFLAGEGRMCQNKKKGDDFYAAFGGERRGARTGRFVLKNGFRHSSMIFMPPSAAKGEEAMMYIHYCKYCRRIHILNGHKLYCPACSGKLSELDISYMKYVNLSREERRALREKCADEKSLRELSVDYPRRGGAKWFQAAEPARTGRTTDNKSASRPEYSPHLRVSVS